MWGIEEGQNMPRTRRKESSTHEVLGQADRGKGAGEGQAQWKGNRG